MAKKKEKIEIGKEIVDESKEITEAEIKKTKTSDRSVLLRELKKKAEQDRKSVV